MLIVGIFMLVFGITTTIPLLVLVDKMSTAVVMLRPKIGISEEALVALTLISIIIAVVGLVLIIFARIKEKNKNMLTTMKNQANHSYCANCNVPVDSRNGTCPICGKALND